MTVRILVGDCVEHLRAMPDNSVHCAVTSPPYWGLRDYGVAGQIGLEKSPQEYVARLVEVFREVRRVLRDDGTFWLNLGDSYAGKGGQSPQSGALFKGRKRQRENICISSRSQAHGLKPKDLVGIPWRVAFALQDDGWYLRQEIIWAKPNPMPESVLDRCTRSHEQMFMLAKSTRYFYDSVAIAEPVAESSIRRVSQESFDEQQGGAKDYQLTGQNANRSARKTIENFAERIRTSGNVSRKLGDERGRPGHHVAGSIPWEGAPTRNKRSVWNVSLKPYNGAHFATFPVDLVEPCILAGTSAWGACGVCGAPWQRKAGTAWIASCGCDASAGVKPCVVLDPFAGAGTTGLVADRHGRDAVLVELNAEYAAMAEKRVRGEAPLLSEVE